MKGKKQPSVMNHNFADIPRADIPRSVFDRSHGYKTTFDAGYLIPFFVDEALPGDTFKVNTSIFARLSTQLAPVMDNMYLDTHFFAVPLRLVWENFKRFMGEQDNPDDSTDYLFPRLNSGGNGFDRGSISDYFGLPVQVADIWAASAWHRAYNLIYNEWFRDENLQDSAKVNRADSGDFEADFPLRRRGKRRDYFTSALPWPQKGPGVELAISGNAPIYGDGYSMTLTDGTNFGGLFWESNTALTAAQSKVHETVGGTTADSGYFIPDAAMNVPQKTDGQSSHLYADLEGVQAVSINSMREAFQLQKLLERDARGGTRYIEIVKSHFNVHSPDARLQRPEYLGGSSSPIVVNPVVQQSESATTPQGNLAGVGGVYGSGHGFHKSFTEHCVIMGICSVRADLTYQQGIPRMFSRRTRYDFYWPTLAHLGEQEILNKEIYAQGGTVDDEVFGYQERYGEYRYYPSKITGKLRSDDPQSLDVWHLAQEFNSLPTLSPTFIEENPPVDRVVAVPSEPHFIADFYIQNKCVRPMPVYSVPGLIDHF